MTDAALTPAYFDPKTPFERRSFTMNFGPDEAGNPGLMQEGDTITDMVVTATPLPGTTEDPTMIDGAASAVGQKVEQWIKGGVANGKYTISYQITTAGGEKLEADGILNVVAHLYGERVDV